MTERLRRHMEATEKSLKEGQDRAKATLSKLYPDEWVNFVLKYRDDNLLRLLLAVLDSNGEDSEAVKRLGEEIQVLMVMDLADNSPVNSDSNDYLNPNHD